MRRGNTGRRRRIGYVTGSLDLLLLAILPFIFIVGLPLRLVQKFTVVLSADFGATVRRSAPTFDLIATQIGRNQSLLMESILRSARKL